MKLHLGVVLAILSTPRPFGSPDYAATPQTAVLDIVGGAVVRTNLAGRFATVAIRDGSLEGSAPEAEVILAQHFSFGWQPIEVLAGNPDWPCLLRGHVPSRRQRTILVDGMAPLRGAASCTPGKPSGDVGPRVDVEAVRRQEPGPLVPTVIVAENFAPRRLVRRGRRTPPLRARWGPLASDRRHRRRRRRRVASRARRPAASVVQAASIVDGSELQQTVSRRLLVASGEQIGAADRDWRIANEVRMKGLAVAVAFSVFLAAASDVARARASDSTGCAASPAKIVDQPALTLPEAAKPTSKTVAFEVDIGSDGRVRGLQMDRSSGDAAVDLAVRQALGTANYQPPQTGCVAYSGGLELTYSLTPDPAAQPAQSAPPAAPVSTCTPYIVSFLNPSARDRKRTGTAVVAVALDASGTQTAAPVLRKGAGSGALDAEALRIAAAGHYNFLRESACAPQAFTYLLELTFQ